jgi:hypothetical protein
MKLAKKILVGILAITVLVSAFAFSTSAETAITVDDINAVFDYTDFDTYLVENFDYDEGDYVLAEGGDVNIGNLVYRTSADSKITADKYLNIAYTPAPEAEPVAEAESESIRIGDFRMEHYDEQIKNLVASFKVRLGDANGNGAKLVLSITYSRDVYFEYPDDVSLVVIDCLDASKASITYPVLTKEGYFKTSTHSVKPNLNTWYDVDVIMDNSNGKYSLEIRNGSETLVSVNDMAFILPEAAENGPDATAGIDSVRLAVVADSDKAATASFDAVKIYEGTLVRDVENPDAALADLIIDIGELANSEELSVEDRFKVAKLYNDFLLSGKYVLPDASVIGEEKLNAVKAIIDGAQKYINQADVIALVEYTANLLKTVGYYEKLAYEKETVNKYYTKLKNIDVSTYEGMSDEYKDSKTYADVLSEALEAYEKEMADLERARLYTIEFVSKVEEAYDPASKDYAHMIKIRNTLNIFIDDVIPEFKYGEYKVEQWGVHPNVETPDASELTKYIYARDTFVVYEELVEKIEEIEKNVAIFEPAVISMKIEKNATVSAEAPYLTKNFKDLYDNYVVAKSVYANGTVHTALDPATYSEELVERIAKYEEFAAYVEARVADYEAFVNAISGAKVTNYYITIVSQLEFAAKYLDADIEYSLEDHKGVKAAIDDYYALCVKAEKMMNDATAFIAAANAIDINADYAALKSKVEAAAALHANGAVVGIEGVEAAEIKYLAAKSKIDALVANSEMLIDTVNELKTAKTLLERRTLIATANNVKDSAEDAINGVSAAKTELAKQIESYNSDVKAANLEYDATLENAFTVTSSISPLEIVYKTLDIIKNLFK